jgi:hypothetical protein
LRFSALQGCTMLSRANDAAVQAVQSNAVTGSRH